MRYPTDTGAATDYFCRLGERPAADFYESPNALILTAHQAIPEHWRDLQSNVPGWFFAPDVVVAACGVAVLHRAQEIAADSGLWG